MFGKEAPPGCGAAETWQRLFHVYQVECQSKLEIAIWNFRIFKCLAAQLYALRAPVCSS